MLMVRDQEISTQNSKKLHNSAVKSIGYKTSIVHITGQDPSGSAEQVRCLPVRFNYGLCASAVESRRAPGPPAS